MLHIPNSAEGNCLTEKENHTLCLKSDKANKFANYQNIIVRNSPPSTAMFLFLLKTVFCGCNAHDQYTNPLARPLLIANIAVWISFKRMYGK